MIPTSWSIVAGLASTLGAGPAPTLHPVTAPDRVGVPAEWRIAGLPTPARPFDGQAQRLVATVERPGRPAARVEAFWSAPQRSTRAEDGKTVFVPAGEPGWRLRFTPMDPGPHRLVLRVRIADDDLPPAEVRFDVRPARLDGFIRVSPSNPHHLVHADGRPFVPIGMNVCWWNDGGLADYERWAERMQAAGMNFARIWMCPWAFGVEAAPGTLGNYDLGQAWALDQALEIFRCRGIQVMLCLDYHGMLNQTKDFWGGNDNWRLNPYNAANGGPAADQSAFFTSPAARRAYRERLRYLVARYASFPNVAVWEFWNEIDNVRQHFQAADMVAWHREMARAVRDLDPYGRLVSTSLTHDVFPDLWRAAELDLVQSHSYNQANPGLDFAERARRFRQSEGKPYLVGEYGVDYRGPRVEDDPKGRGLKQALWGSLLGGGAGTAQSWWWETLDAQNAYPTFRSIADFAAAAPIGGPGWGPLTTATEAEPGELPPADAAGAPFGVRIRLTQAWGSRPAGRVLLTDAAGAAAQGANLDGFVHGTTKPDLVRPFVLEGWFGEGARVAFRVNSVSDRADLRIRADGKELGGREFVDRDGRTEVADEFGEEVAFDVPAGTRRVELVNVGPDWAALDWVEVRGVRPAVRTGDGGTPVRAVASGDGRAAAVWILDPAYSYPANAKEPDARRVERSWAEVGGLQPGRARVRWWDTAAGRWTGEVRVTVPADGRLRLTVPPFREDVAALIDRG